MPSLNLFFSVCRELKLRPAVHWQILYIKLTVIPRIIKYRKCRRKSSYLNNIQWKDLKKRRQQKKTQITCWDIWASCKPHKKKNQYIHGYNGQCTLHLKIIKISGIGRKCVYCRRWVGRTDRHDPLYWWFMCIIIYQNHSFIMWKGKVRITQKKEKKEETLTEKIKRSPDEKHT